MKEANKHELAVKSVAYCGLVCMLDSCYENCDGCRSGKGCGDNQCFQKVCCTTRGLYGCWNCPEFPCGKGYFADFHPSHGQFVGCVRYIKEFGLENYVAAIIRNQGKGLKYGLNGAYGDKTETEVMSLLKTE
jgi:hypothetical protein